MLSGCNIVLVDGVVFSLELAAYFPFSYRLCLVDGTRMTLLAMCEGERGRMVALAPPPRAECPPTATLWGRDARAGARLLLYLCALINNV